MSATVLIIGDIEVKNINWKKSLTKQEYMHRERETQREEGSGERQRRVVCEFTLEDSVEEQFSSL